MDENTPAYPGSFGITTEEIGTLEREGWREKKISLSTHFGTHIDAPAHMLTRGKTITDYPPEKFFGPAVVLDASRSEPGLAGVKKNDIVLLHTNGREVRKSTALALVKKKVKIVGVDSLSPDEEPFEIHKILLKKDVLIIENITGLKKLVGKRCLVYALPMKIKGADGAPCRVIAQY